jgi:hypothetical protein
MRHRQSRHHASPARGDHGMVTPCCTGRAGQPQAASFIRLGQHGPDSGPFLFILFYFLIFLVQNFLKIH